MHYFSAARVLWVGPTLRFHKKNCNLKCNLSSVGSCVTVIQKWHVLWTSLQTNKWLLHKVSRKQGSWLESMGFNKRHNVVTVIWLTQRSYAQMKRGEKKRRKKKRNTKNKSLTVIYEKCDWDHECTGFALNGNFQRFTSSYRHILGTKSATSQMHRLLLFD